MTAIRPDYLAFGRPDFSEAEIDAVARTMRSGWIGMGAEVAAFEQELARATGAPHVVAVDTCTSALFLSLLVHGIGAGDEVVTPSLTWCATANAAIYLGARPVFCDVDPETLCATPETIARRLTPRTRAVVAVHYGGRAADVEAIRASLPPRVALVEDAAHAFGGSYSGGKPVGASGHLACFSFYANKNLSTGEGGAVALFDDEMAGRLKSLRQNGLSADAWKRFIHPEAALVPGIRELGYKMNYTDLQAAIGRVQLARQAQFAARRRAIAGHYVRALEGFAAVLRIQQGILDDGHARHLFVVTLDAGRLPMSRNELLLALRARKVGASVHYQPLHTMPYYQGIDPVRLEVTEFLAPRIMTLPIGAAMDVDDAAYVVAHLKELAR
jgi:dTDP-4-amino-4,6-dideoxygalactose transaminase